MIEPACASRCSQIDTFLARNRSGYRHQCQASAESNPTACAWQPFPSRTLPKDPCHRWFRGLQVGPDIVGQRRSKRSAEHRPPCACGYGSNKRTPSCAAIHALHWRPLKANYSIRPARCQHAVTTVPLTRNMNAAPHFGLRWVENPVNRVIVKIRINP